MQITKIKTYTSIIVDSAIKQNLLLAETTMADPDLKISQYTPVTASYLLLLLMKSSVLNNSGILYTG